MSIIIIGAATQVDFGGACVISAQWGFSPNVQRLYCIGSWTASDDMTFYKPTETLSLTIYSPGPTYDVAPTTSCADANTIQASVIPAACGGAVGNFSGSWFVTGYNYSKQDKGLPGQESWSLTRWDNLNTQTPSSTTVYPTYVMRGISEGQATEGVDTGIEFSGSTYLSSTGSVQANGFGTADVLENGIVVSVGGGTSSVGVLGQGSANMPYTPLYI